MHTCGEMQEVPLEPGESFLSPTTIAVTEDTPILD